MRLMFLAIAFTYAIVPSGSVPEASKWYGLRPLRTTRHQVERRLGASKSDCKCVYELPRERIFVRYSSGGCNNAHTNGWRVPSDTVISFQVYPKYKVRFSDLKLDGKAFIKQDNEELPGAFHYLDKKAGIGIEVDNDLVVSYNYTPSLKDNHLRCKLPH